MSAPVGADIESICRKCGDVWHVVVAKVGDRIAKVLCKQCNGTHKYRPPGDAQVSSGSSGARARSSSSGAGKSSQIGKAPTVSRRLDEPQVPPNEEKPRRPYKFSESYEPGDRIDHPKFGFGVVEITSEPGKMQVFFPDGRRVLALAKKESSLTRPSRDDDPDREPPKW